MRQKLEIQTEVSTETDIIEPDKVASAAQQVESVLTPQTPESVRWLAKISAEAFRRTEREARDEDPHVPGPADNYESNLHEGLDHLVDALERAREQDALAHSVLKGAVSDIEAALDA